MHNIVDLHVRNGRQPSVPQMPDDIGTPMQLDLEHALSVIVEIGGAPPPRTSGHSIYRKMHRSVADLAIDRWDKYEETRARVSQWVHWQMRDRKEAELLAISLRGWYRRNVPENNWLLETQVHGVETWARKVRIPGEHVDGGGNGRV